MKRYLTPHSPTYGVQFSRETVRAVNGVLTLDPSQAAELDRLLKSRPDIRANVREIDEGAAAAAIQAHQKTLKRAAVQGADHSASDPGHIMRDASANQDPKHILGTDNPQPLSPPAPPLKMEILEDGKSEAVKAVEAAQAALDRSKVPGRFGGKK